MSPGEKPPSISVPCALRAGPNIPLSTPAESETQTFSWYGGTIMHYFPATFNGPAGVGATVTVPSLPYLAVFSCYPRRGSRNIGLPGVKWVDPTIDIGHETTQKLVPSRLIEVGPIGPR